MVPSCVSLQAWMLLMTVIKGVLALSFTEEPSDVIVWEGSSVVLPCKVNGSSVSPLTFTWYKNGQTQLPTTSQSSDGSLIMLIPHSPTSYEQYDGLYHCVVSSQHTGLRSRDASLRVSRRTKVGTLGGSLTRGVYFPRDIVGVTQEGYFHPLQPVWDISCSSSTTQVPCPSSECSLLYSLYPIERQKSLSVLILSLNQLQNMTGEETCINFVLQSVWEEDNSKFLQVKFTAFGFTPRLSVVSVDSTAEVGSDAELPCIANAASSYTWTKDSSPLDVTSDSRMKVLNGSLNIKRVTDTDSGEYVCTAVIERSKRRSPPATLSVYVLPTVTMSLSGRIPSGELLTVMCNVSGSRPLTVELLLDGSVEKTVFVNSTVTPYLRHRITISKGRSIVQCVASNDNGSSQTSQYIDTAPTDPPSTTRRDFPTLPATSLGLTDVNTPSGTRTPQLSPSQILTSAPKQSPSRSFSPSISHSRSQSYPSSLSKTPSSSVKPSPSYAASPSSSFTLLLSPSFTLSPSHTLSQLQTSSRSRSETLLRAHSFISPQSHLQSNLQTLSQSHFSSLSLSFLSSNSLLLLSSQLSPSQIMSSALTPSPLSTPLRSYIPSVSLVPFLWYASSPSYTSSRPQLHSRSQAPSPLYTSRRLPIHSPLHTPSGDNSTDTPTTQGVRLSPHVSTSSGLDNGATAGIAVLSVIAVSMSSSVKPSPSYAASPSSSFTLPLSPSFTLSPSHTLSQLQTSSRSRSETLLRAHVLISPQSHLQTSLQTLSQSHFSSLSLSFLSSNSLLLSSQLSPSQIMSSALTPSSLSTPLRSYVLSVSLVPSLWYASSPSNTSSRPQLHSRSQAPSPLYTSRRLPIHSPLHTPSGDNSTDTPTTPDVRLSPRVSTSSGLDNGATAGIAVLSVIAVSMTVLFLLALLYRRRHQGSYSIDRNADGHHDDDHAYEDMEYPEPKNSVQLTSVVTVYDCVAPDEEDGKLHTLPASSSGQGHSSDGEQNRTGVRDDVDVYDDVVVPQPVTCTADNAHLSSENVTYQNILIIGEEEDIVSEL